MIIEGAGYTARTTQDMVGAIHNFNQRRPTAVVLDLSLPDINGLEFCRYVRRNAQHNAIPMIITNATKMKTNVTDIMNAGADFFLDTPMSAKELRHVVSSLVTQYEGGGNAAIHTKHLVGTAPLKGVKPESRRDAAVLFIAGYGDAPLVVTVPPQQPMSLGRNATTGSLGRHHIDLTRYDAVNFGVSRLHMFLHNRDHQFFVEDARSVNGTFVNGEPIKAGEMVAVKNADEIRLGGLRMYIYFLGDSEEE